MSQDTRKLLIICGTIVLVTAMCMCSVVIPGLVK